MTDNQPYMDKESAIIFLMNNPNEFIMDINTIWCLDDVGQVKWRL